MKKGIIMPQMAHRFIAIPRYYSNNNTDLSIFTDQIEKCYFDMKAKTLEVYIRHPIVPVNFLTELEILVDNCQIWNIRLLDGSHGIISNMDITNCELQEAKFSLDYSNGSYIVHVLKYKYKKIIYNNLEYEDIEISKGCITPEEAVSILKKHKEIIK